MPESRDDAVLRLIGRHPLAWVISGGFDASLLPLLAERDADGALVSLLGHCANHNPLLAAFAGDPRGLVLFNGPSAYVSPALIDKPDWGPTWNYAGVRCTVAVEIVPAETAESLERLLDHLEGARPGRWTIDRMGPRYAEMLRRISAFRARIVRVDAHFKLGQDEAHREFDEIVARHPDRALADWMTALADRPATI